MANGKDTIWSVPFVVLMAVNFFQSMAAFMANATLPVFADSLGASASMVGVVVSTFTLSALLVRPFAGPAFDSFSRKKLLLGAQGIICLSLFLYGVVDDLGALCAVRLLHGVGIGCGGPLAMSLVSEFLPANKFASGISIYALAQSFAQVIGPATGLYLVNFVGFSAAYFLAAALLLVAMGGIFLIREPYREHLPYQLKLSRMFAREAVSKAAALMLLGTSFSCMASYVVLYGYERGVADMGVFFIVYALCLVVTRPVFGTMADRVGTPKVLVLGVVCFAVSYGLLSQAHDLGGFLAAAVFGSAGFGCCAPLLQSMGLASVSVEHRGAASNTMFTGLDLGTMAGPLIGGAVVESLALSLGSQVSAYSSMWLIMLVPAMGTLIIALFWCFRRAKG
ncbi:MFS transporter [Adlercreutzia equolifaciens]|uniref:MFS transporter n=1 Tax=Adlercreutzia equolifaciens TaxID=446660 RepID=UPI0023B164D1|nr:MFS transporter [Adlercreutzia equolifaciens]MDE8702898.1 MFS transporter [Adlercreutzia equolifaciens]